MSPGLVHTQTDRNNAQMLVYISVDPRSDVTDGLRSEHNKVSNVMTMKDDDKHS